MGNTQQDESQLAANPTPPFGGLAMSISFEDNDDEFWIHHRSRIFEAKIYATTQAIDVVAPGQRCDGAVQFMFGLAAAKATEMPFDLYSPEDLPATGGSDNFSEAPALMGEDGSLY
ncbi:hypothetical protein EG327_002780 [Venturia inaequalis]|uniref:Uncharacterized protein n=1 Tax=Venturia inaequalis TaxID=5025 RepID=A0A8H3VVX0_VENIN|nr:hypothetical protein EG327_002780 [Venturia inaequalis]